MSGFYDRAHIQGAARACGCDAELEYNRGYPILRNDREATARSRRAVVDLFGEEALLPDPTALMAGEDFARYAERIPAAFVFLGAGSEEKGITSPNHATDFDVDEEVLYRGTAWFLALSGEGEK